MQIDLGLLRSGRSIFILRFRQQHAHSTTQLKYNFALVDLSNPTYFQHEILQFERTILICAGKREIIRETKSR